MGEKATKNANKDSEAPKEADPAEIEGPALGETTPITPS